VHTLRRMSILLAAIAVTFSLSCSGSLGARPAARAYADGPITYTFEDGADGFTAPTWLGANAGQPVQSAAQHSEGSYSLALPVNFSGGSYDQAGADKVFDNYNPVDLTVYKAVSYDVYVPAVSAGSFSSDIVFNDPWHPSTTGPKSLQAGWNTVTFDLSASSADFPNSQTYFSTAKEFILRVVGQGATYSGNIYFDNVRFIPTTNPIVQLVAPQTDDTLSVPQGQSYTIKAQVRPSLGRQISSITFGTPTQSGPMTLDSASGLYTAAWDLWREGEGLKTLTITATDNAGASTSTQVTVLVQNSQLQVHITAPTFDQQLDGKTTVSAQVQPDPRFPLQSVTLTVGGLTLPMSAGSGGVYTVSLDTQRLGDGVQTLRVTAQDSQFAVTDLVDTLVENQARQDLFVHTAGTTFDDGHGPFRYVGWNEYDLFTRTDQTVAHDEQTSEGNVLLKGTVIPWRTQIDRQMMEAERNGLRVLRTWAFDNSSDPYAFQTAPGVYNEAAFQKLDYIVASAARHHMRVILTMENNWGDYGGIVQVAKWLNLPNKLLFFTDAGAQTLYKNYVAHLVNRVNTVTGVAYKSDPTIFSWELMNEPRMDCTDDPTPNHTYCDPSGTKLRAWISMMSGYVKSLDPNHMVSTGSEGHGCIPLYAGSSPQDQSCTSPQTGGPGLQWAGSQEGDNNDPLYVQNVPTVDFFCFHPYPNEPWANLTLAQTNELIDGITKEGMALGKPVVMEEYGVKKSASLNLGTTALQPTDSAFNATRVQWYKDMLDTFYGAGGVGSNIWQLADWSDSDYNVNPYLPLADAQRDAPLVGVLAQEAAALQTQNGPGPIVGPPAATPELGSGDLVVVGIIPALGALLYGRRKRRRADKAHDRTP
jgi:hypothetical protein